MPAGVLVDDCPCCRERLRIPTDAFRGRAVNCPECEQRLEVDGDSLSWPDAPQPAMAWQPWVGGFASASLVTLGLLPAIAGTNSHTVSQSITPKRVRPLVVGLDHEVRRPAFAPIIEVPREQRPLEVPMIGVGDAPPEIVAAAPTPAAVPVIEPDPREITPIDVPMAVDRVHLTRLRLARLIGRLRHPRAVSVELMLDEIEELAGVAIERSRVEAQLAGRRVRLSLDEVTIDELLTATIRKAELDWSIRWDGVVVLTAAVPL